MAKIMLHDEAARAALGRGVAKLAKAVRGTLGPKGMNAIMDRPIGTPVVSRDGVSIASEIELECPFENMGAQVLREVSKQTNDVAGDGTTTATVLADVLVQDGLKCDSICTALRILTSTTRSGPASKGAGRFVDTMLWFW